MGIIVVPILWVSWEIKELIYIIFASCLLLLHPNTLSVPVADFGRGYPAHLRTTSLFHEVYPH